MMAERTINCIYVVTIMDGLNEELQILLKQQHIDIEIKSIDLKKYGDTQNSQKLRELTCQALQHDVEVEDVEFLLGCIQVIVEILSHPNNKLKWAHCPTAGVDAMFRSLNELKLGEGFLLTRTTGLERGRMMGDYVIGHIVARERNFMLQAELQKSATYDRSQQVNYRMLSQLSIGVLGTGSIGSEVARVCKAMNATVWTALRDARYESGDVSIQNVDHVRPMSRLHELLEQVDYLACVLPSTPQTRGLLSGDTLKACQARKTVLINTGRGDLIDDESLVNAVSQDWLGGAILDVLNTEPLPKDSPLWTLPGVTITPHVSCLCRNSAFMVSKQIMKNIQRYLRGEKLNNAVDFTKGY